MLANQELDLMSSPKRLSIWKLYVFITFKYFSLILYCINKMTLIFLNRAVGSGQGRCRIMHQHQAAVIRGHDHHFYVFILMSRRFPVLQKVQLLMVVRMDLDSNIAKLEAK